MTVKSKVGVIKDGYDPGKPKCTRQGLSKNTNLASTARNKAKKKYRGQGK